MDDPSPPADEAREKRGAVLRFQGLLLPPLLLAAGAAVGYGLYRAQRNALALEILHPGVFDVARIALFAGAAAVPLALALTLLPGERRPRTLTPLRVLFYLVVLGHQGLVAAVENFERIYFDLVLGLVAGAFAGFVLARRYVPRWKVLKVVDFLLFQICALLVVCELLLRFIAAVAPSPLLTLGDTAPQKYIETYQLEPGSLRYGKRVNSAGYYDDEFTKKQEGETLIVSVGDSFSVGIVPFDFLYTTIAERNLENTRLHNFGVVACGPREYLFMLEQDGLIYKPDAVLINVYVGNDFLIREEENADNLFLRSFCDRKSLMVWVVPGRIRSLVREARGRGEEPLVTDTEAQANVRRPPHIDDLTKEVPTYTPQAFMRIEVQRATETCAEGSPYPSPRFFEYLQEIVDVAGETPVLFSIIPDEFQVEDALWEQVVAQADPNARLDRGRPQRLLKEWFDARDLPYVDFLPAMRAVEPMEDGDRHLFHLRDTHINARGNAVAGEELTKFLREELGL